MLKFGNVSLNPLAFKETSFEDFRKVYGGYLIGYDINKAWGEIQAVVSQYNQQPTKVLKYKKGK